MTDDNTDEGGLVNFPPDVRAQLAAQDAAMERNIQAMAKENARLRESARRQGKRRRARDRREFLQAWAAVAAVVISAAALIVSIVALSRSDDPTAPCTTVPGVSESC